MDFQTTPRMIQAEQWDGTLTSLLRIQTLIAPRSPYQDGEMKTLGIPVTVAGKSYTTSQLTFVESGGWVIKDGDQIRIATAAQFAAEFQVPAAAPPGPPALLDILYDFHAAQKDR